MNDKPTLPELPEGMFWRLAPYDRKYVSIQLMRHVRGRFGRAREVQLRDLIAYPDDLERDAADMWNKFAAQEATRIKLNDWAGDYYPTKGVK